MSGEKDAPVCIITGSTQGIGKATALAFAQSGARVVINDLPNRQEDADAAAQEVREAGGEAITALADVGDPEAVKKMFETVVSKWQTVDVLVNNAGIQRPNLIPDMEHEQWHNVLRTHLTGSFYTTQAALKIMQERKKGRIVNLASVCTYGTQTQANYAAAKGGIVAFTKTVALENAAHQITCNAVSPGVIDTPMIKETTIDPQMMDLIVSRIPMGRIGKPEEVAELIKYLALHPAGGYITGQVIDVNGGLHM